MILYFWRRIANIECYNTILEKRITNLKKENKELKEKSSKENVFANFQEAECQMQKIFSDVCETNGELHIISDSSDPPDQSESRNPDIFDDISKIIEGDSCEKNPSDTVCVTEVTDVTDAMNVERCDLPVANHFSDLNDTESIVSDVSKYTRKNLSKMNLDKLKDICVTLNISNEGTKNTLIEKILSQ